jgi:hypothetical protein
MAKVPTMLAAFDKKRNRIFVLAQPNVCAVRMDGVWHNSVPVPMDEIDNYYDLITDLRIVKSLVEEAKAALEIP